jgi:hypothetical protein
MDIYGGLSEFITSNNTYESSVVINSVILKIRATNKIEEIFKIPIIERIFNFDSALQWFYFICFVIDCIRKEANDKFDYKFSTENAIVFISNNYDLCNENLYHEYFDED